MNIRDFIGVFILESDHRVGAGMPTVSEMPPMVSPSTNRSLGMTEIGRPSLLTTTPGTNAHEEVLRINGSCLSTAGEVRLGVDVSDF